MTRLWASVERFAAKYRWWAGAASAAGAALIVWGGFAVVHAARGSEPDSVLGLAPSIHASPSASASATRAEPRPSPSSSHVSASPSPTSSPGHEALTLIGTSGWGIGRLASSADGSVLVYGDGQNVTGPARLYAVNLSTLKTVTLNANGRRWYGAFSVSPDGRWVAYAGPSVFGACDTTSGTCQESPIDGGVLAMRWRPDSSVYVATVGATPGVTAQNFRIVTIDPATLAFSEVSPGYLASWSPDGSQLAWYLDSNGDSVLGAVVAAPDGSSLQPITPEDLKKWSGGGLPSLPPEWSHDGSRIALALADDDGNSQLFIYAADGSAKTEIQGIPRLPIGWTKWSADDRYIAAYVPNDTFWTYPPQGKVYVAALATGQAVQIAGGTPPVVDSPVWAPSGARLGVVSGSDVDLGTWVDWASWVPGQSGATSVVEGCTSAGITPILIPTSDGRESTTAVGWLDCPDAEGRGLYLIDLDAVDA